MLQEAIEFIAKLGGLQRSTTETISDGSGRVLVFEPATLTYRELERFVKRVRSVSNIESLAAMVLEEARRASYEERDADGTRALGDWMTVVFNAAGAEFHLDDRDGRTVFAYKRELSPQWNVIRGQDGRTGLSHVVFLRLLQSLRPSLVTPAVIAEFRRIDVSAGIHIESAPTLEHGKSGSAYRFELRVNGRAVGAAVPSTIELRMPFARNSSKHYTLEAEVVAELAEKGDKKELQFGLVLPERGVVEEQAIADEVLWFREQVKPLSLLSVLEDY